ncbi:hypothetical protein SISSUDRAFT_1125722 [Sistotremastrum suecicum HHB10207 ss-3]|uniref:GIT Spa2 homology (SHD) domain-containing protein n=1 Tax=Sistotremastrum suecicum HHB10207 ss-3 TaxID=1314776 RepID=A0A166H363_9AGAM|nr:hypothetical protein SISSUDRAFT_1125722 [Sistotremastrum suecicum HHB10207 ss-3]
MSNKSLSGERFRIVQHASGLPFELSESGSVVPTPSTLRMGFRFTLDGTPEEEAPKPELPDEFFVTCFRAMNEYLSEDLIKEKKSAQRMNTRQKIGKLTKQQFLELCTDVFDEMIRRTTEEKVPFLSHREGFHPKRNQARQKLSTLPLHRFQDLCSDIHYELERQYFSTTEGTIMPRTPSSVHSDLHDPPPPYSPSDQKSEGI